MATRFYLTPKIGAGTAPDPLRPKYVFERGLNRPGSAYMPYGHHENVYLSGLVDIADAEHTALAAESDVLAVPANLDANLSAGAVTTIQGVLENWRIPSAWVTTALTYRQVIGRLGRLFQFMQRFSGRELRTVFTSGITLDTRINQLSTAQRNAIQDNALSFGLSIDGITGTTLIRAVLVNFITQMAPFTLAGETF